LKVLKRIGNGTDKNVLRADQGKTETPREGAKWIKDKDHNVS